MRKITLITDKGRPFEAEIREFQDAPEYVICDDRVYKQKAFDTYEHLGRTANAYFRQRLRLAA